MTTPTASLDTAPAAPTKPAALWEDFIDIFTQPRAVFERRRDGRYWPALLVLSALAAGLFFATRPVIQPLIDRAMEAGLQQQVASGKMTAEQAAQGRAMVERFAGVGTILGAVFGTPILVFVSGALLWLGGRVAGARLTYPQAVTATTYANVPRVLVGGVLGALVLGMTDPQRFSPLLQSAPLGPAFLLGADASSIAIAVAQRFDLTVVWGTVLAAIGAGVMARKGRPAWGAAAFAWGLATLWALWQGFRATL
jgi:hypothetical protein